MATGETFNHNKLNRGHKKYKFKVENASPNENNETNDNSIIDDNSEKKSKNRLIKAALIGAGAITAVTGGLFASRMHEEQQLKSITVDEPQITESVQTPEDKFYETYGDWKTTDYKDSIESLESSTIDNLSEKNVLNSEKMSQEDIDKLGSFYMDKIIDSSVLYGYLNDPNVYALISYKEYQKKALDMSNDEARGQAILDLEFWSRIASYSQQGKEAMAIQRLMNLVESVNSDKIITSGVCSDTIIMINDLEKQGSQAGHKIVVNNPRPDQIPKFISFEEQLPTLTDSTGNTYRNAEIIKYQVDNQEFYKLVAWPNFERIDYKGDDIELPMTIIYGNSVDDVKQSALELVSY